MSFDEWKESRDKNRLFSKTRTAHVWRHPWEKGDSYMSSFQFSDRLGDEHFVQRGRCTVLFNYLKAIDALHKNHIIIIFTYKF